MPSVTKNGGKGRGDDSKRSQLGNDDTESQSATLHYTDVSLL